MVLRRKRIWGSRSSGTKNVKVPQVAINIVITATFNAPRRLHTLRLWKNTRVTFHVYRGHKHLIFSAFSVESCL